MFYCSVVKWRVVHHFVLSLQYHDIATIKSAREVKFKVIYTHAADTASVSLSDVSSQLNVTTGVYQYCSVSVVISKHSLYPATMSPCSSKAQQRRRRSRLLLQSQPRRKQWLAKLGDTPTKPALARTPRKHVGLATAWVK